MEANWRTTILIWPFAVVGQLAVGQSHAPATKSTAKTPVDVAALREGEAFIKEPTRVGLSIAIIQNGQTYFYNFGTTEKGKHQLPTQHTAYEIGSISKTFTGLLLAQAVLEKRVSLDADIRQYLKGDYPNLEYQGQPIQLRHLANTTSSLPDNLPDLRSTLEKANPDSIPFIIRKITSSYTKQDYYHDLHAVKLDTVPGLIRRHSNAAAQLLAYILENVYQMPYEQLLAKYIEQPLQMKATVVAGGGPDLLAVGYNEKGARMPYDFIDKVEAAGGLRYSPAEMIKYVKHQLNETDKAVALSHQPTWGTVEEEAMGLSWLIHKTVDSKRALTHTGGTFGFASYCAVYPELGFGIVLFSNESDRETQGVLRQTAEQVMDGIYGVPPALKALQTGLRAGGTQPLDVYTSVKKKHPELHLTEDYVNEWGYALARQGKIKQAIGLFKLNVGLYPNNWNTYDSLAEAYEMSGDSALAIANYKRSLVLNPRNKGAVEHLQKLGQAAGK